ncbi:MAG TPA: ABC transporter permease [Candidatus Coprovivens excrementavium]|nr:ABC transporter permease [Candidatus Coprovivens excrementavium]
MSNEQKSFIKKYKIKKAVIFMWQVFILLFFLILWEVLSKHNIINPFIFSSPSKVVKCIINLYKDNNLFIHIWVTIYETLIAFVIGLVISFLVSIILYLYNTVYKVLDLFLTCLNSLPKVALGPMIIIIAGANTKSIIVMAVLINLIVSIVVITDGFYNTDKIKIKLMNSFGASKYQIVRYLVIPSSYKTIISSFKLSISMSLIGVVSGEFLVSKAGLGYLIIYGTQVFNLDLVISGILLLVIISYILYRVVEYIEKLLLK